MKTATLFITLSFTIGTANATPLIGVYDQAPDWTATDLNGNSHTLSNYLNDGYTVILDFFTTTCVPCQEFHQSQTLQTLYAQHGPGTADDKLMVFLVTYANTPELGGGQGSIDWITGTPYPIICDANVMDLYGLVAFPRVLTICPTGMVIDDHHGSIESMWAMCETCDHLQADSPHDATLLGTGGGECTAADDSHTTILFNVGQQSLTNVAIEAVECGTGNVLSSTTWTGVLASYEQTAVSVPGWSAPPGDQCVYYRITSPDDDDQNDASPQEIYRSQSAVAPSTHVTLEVFTDAHGADWSWFLQSMDLDQVANVQQGSCADNTLYTQTFDLDPGSCWWFNITNESGYGFQPPGYYRLTCNGLPFITEAETFQVNGGPTVIHGAYFSTTAVTGLADPGTNALPVQITFGNEQLQLSVLKPGDLVQLMDAAGRLIRQDRSSGSSMSLDLAGLGDGLYAVVVAGTNARMSRSFVIAQ